VTVGRSRDRVQKDGGMFVVGEAADGIENRRGEFVHSVANGRHVGLAAVVAVVENRWGPRRRVGCREQPSSDLRP
jgi:hypothetical protein